MPVRDLLTRVDSRELMEWAVYFRLRQTATSPAASAAGLDRITPPPARPSREVVDALTRNLFDRMAARQTATGPEELA
jgi:hypothetical protein